MQLSPIQSWIKHVIESHKEKGGYDRAYVHKEPEPLFRINLADGVKRINFDPAFLSSDTDGLTLLTGLDRMSKTADVFSDINRDFFDKSNGLLASLRKQKSTEEEFGTSSYKLHELLEGLKDTYLSLKNFSSSNPELQQGALKRLGLAFDLLKERLTIKDPKANPLIKAANAFEGIATKLANHGFNLEEVKLSDGFSDF